MFVKIYGVRLRKRAKLMFIKMIVKVHYLSLNSFSSQNKIKANYAMDQKY